MDVCSYVDVSFPLPCSLSKKINYKIFNKKKKRIWSQGFGKEKNRVLRLSSLYINSLEPINFAQSEIHFNSFNNTFLKTLLLQWTSQISNLIQLHELFSMELNIALVCTALD